MNESITYHHRVSRQDSAKVSEQKPDKRVPYRTALNEFCSYDHAISKSHERDV